MGMILADVGAAQISNSYFNKTQPAGGDNLTLKLFVNNVIPSDSDTAATYTEAIGGGYAAKTLVAGSFIVSTVAGIVQAAYAQQQFMFTGALTTNAAIYGAYIVDADGVLIFAEAAPIAYTPAVNGDMYAVTPTIKLSKGTPT